MAGAPEIFDDPWFRLMCSAGFALFRFRELIFAQTDDEDGRDWLSVIELLEKECFSAQQQGTSSDSDYLIKRARQDFAKVAERFGEENEGLRKVLRKLARDLQPFKPKSILASFDELNRRGLLLTQNCARKWGGPHSRTRASKLKPFRLGFDEPEATSSTTPVCTWTDTSRDTIHLVIGGGQRPLINFLSLEFYLLHEYLSHVFPTWEDGAGKLSEGYLFRVARWWHTKQTGQIESAIADVDWNEHWGRLNFNRDAMYWRKFHLRSDWFEVHSSIEWISFVLLELAGFNNTSDSSFQPQLLAILKQLHRHNSSNEVESVCKMPSLPIEAIYREFHAGMRKKVPVKTLQRLEL